MNQTSLSAINSDLNDALKHYEEHIRRQNLPPFELSGLQALFPELEPSPDPALDWPKAWPFGDRQGVYFIFGSAFRLLYVGKASMRHRLGDRLSSYVQYERPAMTCRVVHLGWSQQPRFVATLAVPDKMSFEAPALEEYLIQTLSPPDNVHGRRPSIGQTPEPPLPN
jgi:hypothetical protein